MYIWAYAHLSHCMPVHNTEVAGDCTVLYIKNGYYSKGMCEMCLL